MAENSQTKKRLLRKGKISGRIVRSFFKTSEISRWYVMETFRLRKAFLSLRLEVGFLSAAGKVASSCSRQSSPQLNSNGKRAALSQ